MKILLKAEVIVEMENETDGFHRHSFYVLQKYSSHFLKDYNNPVLKSHNPKDKSGLMAVSANIVSAVFRRIKWCFIHLFLIFFSSNPQLTSHGKVNDR